MKKKTLYIFLIPIVLTLLVQTWWSLGSVYKLWEIEKITAALSKDTTLISNHPDLIKPLRENAFKSALWSLSTSDSIHLIINLKDTSVGLFINGIMIHKSQPHAIKIDPVFAQLSNRAYLTLFEKPIRITQDSATIVKEPIVVREAPKDTIEAALNAYKPDTLIQRPAFWKIELPHGLQLIFAQVAETELEQIEREKYFNQLMKNNFNINRKRLSSFQKPLYKPTIQIDLPVDDLRAMYRALPNQGSLVLYY